MDTTLFEQVVTVHGETVWRVCCTVVGRQDAEDAWSETYLAALRAFPRLPADVNVQAWLVTIAHHKCIDLLRARRRRPLPVAELSFPAEDSRGNGTSGVLLGRSTTGFGTSDDPLAEDAIRALAELPLKQRQAVAYHHLAGLPYPQVAQILGGTPAAARRAGADGIAALRRKLSGSTDHLREDSRTP